MPTQVLTTRETVQETIEELRQHVIAARSSVSEESEADSCVERLNQLYAQNREDFTAEDIRFVNVMRGFLGSRYEALRPKTVHTKKAKRKGDKLDHCWRCTTPVDERFVDMCPTCYEKPYQFRICPVCKACGCQRAGTVLV